MPTGHTALQPDAPVRREFTALSIRWHRPSPLPRALGTPPPREQSAGPPHIIRFTQPTGSRPSAARTTAKAVNEDDTAELPTFGVQRSALMAGPFRLQPGGTCGGGWHCRRGPVTVRWRVGSNDPRRRAAVWRYMPAASVIGRVVSDLHGEWGYLRGAANMAIGVDHN